MKSGTFRDIDLSLMRRHLSDHLLWYIQNREKQISKQTPNFKQFNMTGKPSHLTLSKPNVDHWGNSNSH